ncbi:hypothetical protein GCM10028787_06950 [Brachybacterium horti]
MNDDDVIHAIRSAFAARTAAGADGNRALHEVALELELSLNDCATAVGRPDLLPRGRGGWTLGATASRWQEDRVGSALAGANPTVMAHLPGGFAVIGDVQFLPGYCVLLTDRPGTRRLSDLPRSECVRFLDSMAVLGEAVETVCAERDPGFRRVNLEILGNTDDFLHAHVWPRFDWEPPEIVTRPVWLHDRRNWSDPATALGPQHAQLRAALTATITSLAAGA